MSVRRQVVIAMMVATIGAGVGIGAPAPSAKSPAKSPPAAGGSGGPVLAVVGPLRVETAEFDQQVAKALETYRARTKTEVDPQLLPLVRRQVLENLIRQRLLALDGRRRGISVSDAEADAQIRRDPTFQQDGVFNEAKYLAIKASNPEAFAAAMAQTKDGLAARKASEQMERETRPDDAAIRAELERTLTRATLEFISLQWKDFTALPEPRESEILAAYAGGAARFRRPEQATLSIIPVDRPAMADSAWASDAGVRAWEQRMRGRADSALAAIRAGAHFSELGALYGGARQRITLRRDLLPAFWRGSARDLDAVFAAPAGTVLTEPVRATSGWVLVRVDAITPAHTAPLHEVSSEIRRELRASAKDRQDERELHALYDSGRDNLRGDGYRLRYAIADTASFSAGEPTPQDLDRFFRAHLADYSSYDKATGTVVERPFALVRDDVRTRWSVERRRARTQEAAERLRDAWSHGRREPGLERSMSRFREIGPVPAGAEVDSGWAGPELGPALVARGGAPGVELLMIPRGFLVYQLLEVVHGYTPTFDQARPALAQQLAERQAAKDEAAAKAAFEKDPSPFRMPGKMEFTRVMVEPTPPEMVELTRDEVERYYRSHLNDFSVQEIVHIRHILITPTGPGAAADAAARAKAEDILKRVRAGEDFAKLAAQYSDDPATKDDGGDIGVFRHGQMLEAVERAAFAMRAGDITGPVRSEVGYHVMECLEYVPATIHPIAEVYANVAHACARAKAVRIAKDRADSLLRTLRTVADARTAARRAHLVAMASEHTLGQYRIYPPELRSYIQDLERLKPHQLYRGLGDYEGFGFAISWVDTFVAAHDPTWDEAKDQAIDAYHRQAARRSLLAKKAELDSMLAAGWSFDSLGTLWGGLQRMTEAAAGTEVSGMGGKVQLDSLVFGRERDPVLAPGQVSDWMEFPGGFTKMRILERLAPDPDELNRRIELRHQVVLWHKLNGYFDRLKARYPVDILDGELRATVLTEPTEP